MPIRTLAFVLALCAATWIPTDARAEEDPGIYQRLIAEKADSVVSVKLVLHLKLAMMGQSQERESNTTATGVVVDPSGLVMIPASSFDPMSGMGRGFRRQVEVNSSIRSIRVVFPGDTREYDAVLGAKDSKLGLGFILIKDLAGKVIKAVDMERTVEPAVGSTLYGVSRLDQGFDHAPVCQRVKISGAVTKPRSMWVVQGGRQHLAEPLYDATGAVAGVVVSQTGVGEEAQTGTFLLPLKVARPTVANALKRAQDELQRILDEEAERAEEAAAAAKEKEAEGGAEGEGKEDGEGETEPEEPADPDDGE